MTHGSRVSRAECDACGEHMRRSKTMLWCWCGHLMSNAYGVFVDYP